MRYVRSGVLAKAGGEEKGKMAHATGEHSRD